MDLPKTKLAKFSKAVEAAQEAFRTEIEAIAEKVRAEILPYFRKHDFDYVSGNGTWFITRASADSAPYYRPSDAVEDEELPQNIRELLNLEVAWNQCLGFYIRDIKRGEWT
jgi:hypothetical protein